MENAKIQFYQKGEATAMVTSYKKGRSSYKLNINSEYIIRISYPGQSSRTISFNTTIPDENLLDVWPSYSFNAELLDGITTEQQLSRPFVRIKYDPDLYDFEPGEFRWDKLEQAEEVKALLTEVVKEYREEEELLALEEQQNEVANKLAEERAATEELEQSVIDEQKALDEAQLIREKELKESFEKESIILKNEFNSKLSDITRAESRIMASKGELTKINNIIRTKEARESRLQGEEKLTEQLEINDLKKKLLLKKEQIKRKEIAALELKNEAKKIESELLTVNKQLNKQPQSPSIDISNNSAAISKLMSEIDELKTAKGLNEVEGLNIKESIELAEKSSEEDKRLENTKAQNVINQKENEISELTEELSFLEKRGSEKNNKINEYKRKTKELEREYKKMSSEDDPRYAYRYHEADIKRLGAQRDYTNNLIFRLNKEQDLLFAENEKLMLFKNLSDDKASINESIEKNNSRLRDIEDQINKSEKQLEDYDEQVNKKNELVDNSLAMVRAYKKQNKDKESTEKEARLLEEQEKANKLKSEAEKLRYEQEEKKKEFKSELADISLEQTKINNDISNLKDEKQKYINQQIPVDDNINDLNKDLKTKSGLSFLQLKAKMIRQELKSLSLGSEITRLNQKISDQEQRFTNSKIEQAEISIEFSSEDKENSYLKENISKLKIKYSELKKSENKYSDRRTTIKKDIKAKQAQLNDLNDQIAQRIEEEKETLASMEKEEAESKRKELEEQRLNEENAKRQSYLEDASRITSLNDRLKKEILLLNKNETLISNKVNKYIIDIQRVRNEQLETSGSQKKSKKLDELLYQYRSHQQKIKLNGIKYKLRIKEIELERNMSDLKLVEAELEPNNTDSKIKESNRHIDNAEDLERTLTEFNSKQTSLKDELANLKSAYENERSKFNSSIALAEKSANESKEAVEQSEDSESTIKSSNDLAQSRELLRAEKEDYKNGLKEIKSRIYELETNETRSLNKDKSYKEKLSAVNQNISLLSGLKKKYKELESLQLELKLMRSQKTTEKIQALLLAKQLEENKLDRKIKVIDEKINSPKTNIIETDVCADLLAKKKRLVLKLEESKADYNDIKNQIAKKEIELNTKQQSIEEDELALRDEEERKKNQKTLSLEASLSVILNDESEIQEQIKAQKALQSKANQKKSKLKTVNGQLKNQRQNLSGGQLVIKDYEISRNELASLKNEYNKYKSELEEYKSYQALSYKRKERIQAEKNLKKLKPYTTISSLISNPSSATISIEITKIQGLITELENNLKIKNDETVIKGLKAKKATEEAKLQAKLKLDKLKKEREEKERKELAAKKEAERIRAQNRAKQDAKMKAQAAVAARPLELKTNTYQEGQYKVQKTVVLSRQQDDIYVKKTDSNGRTIYRKNDRPITASTYELELRRLRQQLDEYNE